MKKLLLTSLLISSCLMGAPLESNLEVLIDKEQIQSKISRVAKELDREYASGDLVIVMVMKGAICLGADLIRALNIPCSIECVQCASYGARGTSRGELQIFGLERLDLQNRDVLLIDDIFDSGHTLSKLSEAIAQKEPRSLKTMVLLRKKGVHHVDFEPDRILFDIENRFVIGYGLDYKELYRGLDSVYAFTQEP